MLDEQTFGELVTYPLLSTISARSALDETQVIHRDRRTLTVRLGRLSYSWMPVIFGHRRQAGGATLCDAALRVSCGVATGADAIYVVRNDGLSVELAPLARPCLSLTDSLLFHRGRPLPPSKAFRADARCVRNWSTASSSGSVDQHHRAARIFAKW